MKKLLIIGAGCISLLSPLAHARGQVDVQIGVGIPGVGINVPGVVVAPAQPYYYHPFPTAPRGISPSQYHYQYVQPVDPCANATYIDGQYNPAAAQAYCRGAYERGLYGR